MTDNIRELERKPDPAVVELCETLLADAKAGKVLGVVVLSNDASGFRRWQAGHWEVKDALYLLEHWKHETLFGRKEQ